MQSIIFDFGNTLATSGLPLNWQEFYRDALTQVLKTIHCEVIPHKIQIGEKLLEKYNTRLYPREIEVNSNIIFSELFQEWGISDLSKIKDAEDIFFSFFLKATVYYPDAKPTLKQLKNKNIKTGVLTDTAYGADKKYLISAVPDIIQYIDVFLSSTDIGFRKPHIKGYIEVAKQLKTLAIECFFVGDEEKDILGANNCGMVSVFIDRNDQSKEFGQQHTIRSLAEIVNLIDIRSP